MQEDGRTIKELIMAVLEKCKEALPELAILSKKFDKLSAGQQQKIRKKDCLNPIFLVRLSECGQNIRLILQNALSLEFQGKEILKRLYNEYMQVIYDVRKYHEQAHNSHDIHANSTQMKSNLLQELNQQTKKREQLEQQLDSLMAQNQRNLNEKELRIHELEQKLLKTSEKGEEKEDMNLSHISKISKLAGVVSGQFYGGEQQVGRLQEDYEYTVQTRRLRRRILELQDLLEQKERTHLAELESQRMQILQLQSKFEQLMKTNSFQNQTNLKLDTQRTAKQDLFALACDHDDIYRMLLVEAATIEEFLIEQQDQ